MAKKKPAKPAPEAPRFTAAQQQVIDHGRGPLLAGAVAGAGKSTTLVERVAKLVGSGVPIQRIMLSAFNVDAASDLNRKLKKRMGLPGEVEVARTLHGIAHSIWKTATISQGFGLDKGGATYMRAIRQGARTIGIDHVEADLVAKFASRVKNDCLVGTFVDGLRALGQTPADLVDVAADVVRKKKTSALRPETLLDLYFAAEDARTTGTELADGTMSKFVTFDDLVFEAARLLAEDEEVRSSWQRRYEYVIVDEAQDLCEAQWRIVNSLAEGHQNITVVGDPGQCHPPGTMIEAATSVRRGLIPIENLKDGDLVSGWNRHAQRMVHGRATKIGVRHFSGSMHHLTAGGRTVPMTPDHKVLARWAFDGVPETCVTYLMFRSDLGYRVGWCKLMAGNGKATRSFHLAQRAKIEKADAVWVLAVHEDRTSASIHESAISVGYGIPTATFEPVNGAQHLTAQAIARTFGHPLIQPFNRVNGERCLGDLGLHPDRPLWPLPPHETDTGGSYKRMTYFAVYAQNVLPGLMSLPSPDAQNAWLRVERNDREPYAGPVYSLDVEKDHAYAANGVVVLNCIYRWRGARPEHFLGFNRTWAATKHVYMDANFRSGQDIVRAANVILDKIPASQKLPMRLTPTRAIAGSIAYRESESPHEEAHDIALNIQKHRDAGMEWKEQAILVRRNDQTALLELALLKAKIPARIVRGHSFFASREAKTALAYLRLIANRANEDDFETAISNPPKYLGRVFIDKITLAWKKDLDWIDVMDASAVVAERKYNSNARDFMAKIRELRLSLAKGRTPLQLFTKICEKMNWERWVEADSKDGSPDNDAAMNFDRVRDFLADFDELAPMLTTIDELKAAQRAAASSRNAVSIATTHAVKGLEWPVVYIAGMVNQVWPVGWSEMIDERRVFYVAITRARDELWLNGYRYKDADATDQTERSPYLTELNLTPTDRTGKQTVSAGQMNLLGANP